MLELLVVVGLVIGTSAACSLFEAVLYSVPASRIEDLDRAKRPSGRILRQMRKRVDRPIAAVLSLNTIANTGGGALAGALAAGIFGAARIWVFSVVFTLAILLFSEVLPKTVGVVYSRGLAPFVARPLAWLVALFGPLIALTQLATRVFRSESREDRVSDDELLTMVRLGLRSGDFQPHEARVIQNVLDLERRTVSEVMTPRPVAFTLGASLTVREAAAMTELDKVQPNTRLRKGPRGTGGRSAQGGHPEGGRRGPFRDEAGDHDAAHRFRGCRGRRSIGRSERFSPSGSTYWR